MESNFLRSSFREKVLEHIFIGECLRRLWQRGIHDVEVLRSEVDGSGYDVVIVANRITRHIQLKSSVNGGKTAVQKINQSLTNRDGGCVVWIGFDNDTLRLGPYRWFGDLPSRPLKLEGFRNARHTKPNTKGEKTVRKNIYDVPRARFELLDDLDEVLERLFLLKAIR